MKNRLAIIVPLHSDQFEPVRRYLMDGEGSCVCGRELTRTSSKFLLGLVNSSYSIDPKARNTILVAAYCWGCCQEINDVMKKIKRQGEMTMREGRP